MVLRLEDRLPFEGHMRQVGLLPDSVLYPRSGLPALWMGSLLVRRGPGGPQDHLLQQ